MAERKTVTYVCRICGTELTVRSEYVSTLSPIYCCGAALTIGEKRKTTVPKASRRGTDAKKKTAASAAKKGTGVAPRRAAGTSAAGKRTRK